MARIQVFDSLPEYSYWADFFEPANLSLIEQRLATKFSYSLPVGTAYADWSVTVTGKGFKYQTDLDRAPVAGAITSVVITNASGVVALRLDQFLTTQRPDLADFFYSALGMDYGNGVRQGASGENALSDLMAGGDIITGSNKGDDIAPGYNLGNDTINAGAGNDFVRGDAGADKIDGGIGYDTLSYQNSFFDRYATKGITLNIAQGTVKDCWGAVDTIKNFEEYRGSRLADTFVGGENGDRLTGLRGADHFDGNGGSDELRYDQDVRFGGTRGIVVKLETSFVDGESRGTILDGFGQTDTVADIESVVGTGRADIFVGSRADNRFEGLAGADSFGGGLGDDAISFGRNRSIGATTGVNVDLSLVSGQIINDGFGNRETATSIEDIMGSDFADTITGNASENVITGGAGFDVLKGGGGADRFQLFGLLDVGDTIQDFTSGVDKLVISTTAFAGMTGGTFKNGATPSGTGSSFYYNATNDTLFWDRDGTGSTYAPVVLAVLTNVSSMVIGDILLA